MKKKIKKFSKYTMNILAFINALLVVLSPIWGWNLDKLIDSIVAINGVIGIWLVGGKIFATPEVKDEK